MDRIEKDTDIRDWLRERVVPTPETWAPVVQMAEALGAKLYAVGRIGMEIDIGTSPGGTWAFDGEIFVEEGEDLENTVLHEVCHWIVALKRGKEREVNFGSDTGEEIETCDTQITWVLVNRGLQRALDVAFFLQYNTANTPIRETLDVGQRFWASVGMPLEVTEEMAQELATLIHPGKTPDDPWEVPYEPTYTG